MKLVDQLVFNSTNTPTRLGEVVSSVSGIYKIPAPYIGMRVYVKDEKRSYVITELESKNIAGVDVPNAEVKAFIPFMSVGGVENNMRLRLDSDIISSAEIDNNNNNDDVLYLYTDKPLNSTDVKLLRYFGRRRTKYTCESLPKEDDLGVPIKYHRIKKGWCVYGARPSDMDKLFIDGIKSIQLTDREDRGEDENSDAPRHYRYRYTVKMVTRKYEEVPFTPKNFGLCFSRMDENGSNVMVKHMLGKRCALLIDNRMLEFSCYQCQKNNSDYKYGLRIK